MLKITLMYVYELCKKLCTWLFWFVFFCVFLVQAIIFSKMWEDLQNGNETPKKAIMLYIISTVAFLGSLFIKNKILLYVFAIGNILLFLYLSYQPELNSYFGYFNALD